MEADKILNELFDGITEKFNNAIGKLKSNFLMVQLTKFTNILFQNR